jgi:fatty-acyl-CoA synthase
VESELTTCPTGPALLLRAARRYADRPAFVADDKVIRYRDIADLMGRAQFALAGMGLKAGDCVACLSSNGAEVWVIGQAAHAMRLKWFWLHPMGSLPDHLLHLAAAKATHLIFDPTHYGARASEIAASADGCRLMALGEFDAAPNLLAAIEAVGAVSPRDISQPFDISGYAFTGGTTGTPKTVGSRHQRQAAMLSAVMANLEFPRRPQLLAAGPISHVTGLLLMPTLALGGSVRMLPGFDLDRVLMTIERDRINLALMVPAMIYRLLDAPNLATTDLSSLELLLYAGSPMSPARIVEALERVGPVFAQLYAQTEAGPVSYLSRADHDAKRPELFFAAGFPLPECCVRLVDADDQEVVPGEPGEICVRSPFVFEGYDNDAEATADALKGGWVHTGDIGRFDENGYLYVVDRKKDMIVTGGFNVFAREVEDAIATLAGTAASAVIGIPDGKWGEAVAAWVVARPGASVTADEVIATVRRVKGPVHAPKIVHIVESLPITPVGKVDKKPLRAAAWANTSRGVN